MREVCFIFKNMKEAKYYFRNVCIELDGFDSIQILNGKNLRIVFPKKICTNDKNAFSRLLIRLKILKPNYIFDNLYVYFTSKNSLDSLTSISDRRYFYNDNYETNYLIKKIEQIY